jgi:hypothetical protein
VRERRGERASSCERLIENGVFEMASKGKGVYAPSRNLCSAGLG